MLACRALLRFAGCAIFFAFFSTATHAEAVLYGVGGDFKGFDPVESGDTESAIMVARVYEGLVEYDYLTRPYRVIPRLAEAMPEVSGDGLCYTFRLKKGVRFPDDPCFPGGKGREVTAEDFIYSFMRVLDPHLESEGDWIFIRHVLGAKEWVKKMGDAPASATYNEKVPGFVAVDSHTLRIQLVKPYPQLKWVLTMPYAFVVPHEAVAYYGEKFREHTVGTGPYRLKSWRRRYRTELVRNPFFSGQKYPSEGEPGDREAGLLADAGKALPLIDRIVNYDMDEYYTFWQMFLAGEVYSSGLNKDYFEKAINPQLGLTDELKKRGIRLYKTPEMSTWYIGFNMKDPVVGASTDPVINERHKKLRQAFACAIDQAKLCEVIYNDRYIPANLPIPPNVPGHSEQPYVYRYDVARAKRLLAEAGYPNGKDAKGNRLRLAMIMPGAGSTDARQEAEFFSDYLRAIGVELDVQQLSFTEYLRRAHDGITQVFHGGWIADYPDGENFLKLFFSKNKCPGVNSTNYENPAFDELYEQAVVMEESPERTALYEKMAALAMEDCTWALLNYPLTYGLYQPWFQNYKPHMFAYANSKFYKVLPH